MVNDGTTGGHRCRGDGRARQLATMKALRLGAGHGDFKKGYVVVTRNTGLTLLPPPKEPPPTIDKFDLREAILARPYLIRQAQEYFRADST